MLEGKPKKERRYWFSLIQDANDGELRVIYRCRKPQYKSFGARETFGVYGGDWSVVMESQDRDHLRSFGRLVAPETIWGKDGPVLDSYFSYLEGREED